MARIIVMPDPVAPETEAREESSLQVLLDERVYPLHLRDGYAAGQLVERLAWAVADAEARRGALR